PGNEFEKSPGGAIVVTHCRIFRTQMEDCFAFDRGQDPAGMIEFENADPASGKTQRRKNETPPSFRDTAPFRLRALCG
ncbi:MAG: hypothetical protein J6A21_00830, partial [Lentisphaeria bacterium]|nr:hypothetical protein [Lentisphaeria bacterium]